MNGPRYHQDPAIEAAAQPWTMSSRIVSTLTLLAAHGQVDGAHHKAWVIDQAVRALIGPNYSLWVTGWEAEYGVTWETGVSP